MSTRTCIHIKTNGVICGSPALRNSTKCYFHHSHRRQLKRRAIALTLSSPNGRMAATQKVFNAIITGRIDEQVARSMLYAIMVGSAIK